MKYKYIISLVCLIALLIGFIPVKKAVKKEYLDKADNYIIVNVQKSTVSQWIAIGNNKGNYDVPRDVKLIGNVPDGYNYAVETGHNSFVCYGKFCGAGDFYGDKYDVFNVDRWEILYPIKRDSLFNGILPNSYLCIFDTIPSHLGAYIFW